MAVSTLLLLIFSFFSRVAVAKAFLPEDWGEFNLGLALTQFLAIVSLLGLHQAVARTISFERDPGTIRKVVRFGLLVVVATSVGVSGLVYLFATPLGTIFHEPSLVPVIQLFSITIGFTLLSMFLAAIFQGFEDALPNAVFNQIVNPGLFLIFVLVALYFHANFLGTMLAYTIANGVAFAALAIYSARKLPQLISFTAPEPPRLPRGLFALSISLWGVSSLAYITAYIDTLVLGGYSTTFNVGQYSAGMTLARLLMAAGAALTFIYLPVAARLQREGDHDTLRRTYVTSTRWILALTLPMLFLFGFLPDLSLRAVFGPAYLQGALALEILVIGSFISVLVGPSNAALAGLGYARSSLISTLIAAAANVVLSFALIPTWGLVGAAVAWSFARALYPAIAAWMLYRLVGINPFERTLVAPLAASLVIGAPIFLALSFVHLAAWTVVPLFGLGIAIFVGSVLVTRSVDRGDLLALHLAERIIGRPLPRIAGFLEQFLVSPPTIGAPPDV